MLYLKEIEDKINGFSNEWSNIHLFPRGNSFFVDPYMKGYKRFAKASGNLLPNLSAVNRTILRRDAVNQADTIFVDSILESMIKGSIINIGPSLELGFIDSIDFDNNSVKLRDSLKSNHYINEAVIPYGYEFIITSINDNIITIKGNYAVAIGDEFLVLRTKDNLDTNITLHVEKVDLLSNDDQWTMNVILDNELPSWYEIGSSIYLRVYPLYKSEEIFIPKQKRGNTSIGPFLIDYVSGRFDEGKKIEENINLQIFNYQKAPILPAVDGTISDNCVKSFINYPVTNMPIDASSFLFMELLEGKLNYNGSSVIFKTNDSGKFNLYTDLVPAFPAKSCSWKIPIKLNDSSSKKALIRIGFHPNNFNDYTIYGGSVNYITVPKFDKDANRLEIVIKSDSPNIEILMNDWNPVEKNIYYLKYEIISKAIGLKWQAGGIQFKPYFFSLNNLTMRFDFDFFNRGKIFK